MTRRLSITDIARFYSGEGADLSEADAAFDELRCTSCGAEVPEQDGELFPPSCPACGRDQASGGGATSVETRST